MTPRPNVDAAIRVKLGQRWRCRQGYAKGRIVEVHRYEYDCVNYRFVDSGAVDWRSLDSFLRDFDATE